MSLEQVIEANTAAVEKLTAALLAGGGAPAAAPESGTGKAATGKAATGKAATGKAAKFKPEQVRDTLIRVKDEIGEEKAKEIISDVGGYEKLAQLVADPSKFDSVMEAAEAALAENDSGGGDNTEDSGL